jgi:hypothetical protein
MATLVHGPGVSLASPGPTDASGFSAERCDASISLPLPKHCYRVQGFVAEEASEDSETYEAVKCVACEQTHLVNPTTGKVLGVEDE